MKYTIELTNKQKAQMDCMMEIVHRYVGFNPKLEPIEDSWECESGKKFLDESKKYIPLDKIKQAREEIENLNLNDYGDNLYQFQAKCTEILDKLIAESED